MFFLSAEHIFIWDNDQALDISLKPNLSPSVMLAKHPASRERNLAGMIPYHQGYLTCGGRPEGSGAVPVNECLFFDVLADEIPVKYPSMQQARYYPIFTKVKGKPWVLAGHGAGWLFI